VVHHDAMLAAQSTACKMTAFLSLDYAIEVGQTLESGVGHESSHLIQAGARASLSHRRLRQSLADDEINLTQIDKFLHVLSSD
jgi:hypothetical protein